MCAISVCEWNECSGFRCARPVTALFYCAFFFFPLFISSTEGPICIIISLLLCRLRHSYACRNELRFKTFIVVASTARVGGNKYFSLSPRDLLRSKRSAIVIPFMCAYWRENGEQELIASLDFRRWVDFLLRARNRCRLLRWYSSCIFDCVAFSLLSPHKCKWMG